MNIASSHRSLAGLVAALMCAPPLIAAAFSEVWFAPHQYDQHAGRAAEIGSVDIAAIRKATARFVDVKVAEAEGYGQCLGCVSGPNNGSMGIHFANGALVGDNALDPLKPEVLIYEPRGDKLRLMGMEHVVIAEGWHTKNQSPPSVMGQQMHFTGSPNRYGMPPHYSLLVWAWQSNLNGALADWNNWVSCAN